MGHHRIPVIGCRIARHEVWYNDLPGRGPTETRSDILAAGL